jgi:serine phosphatase RsbU (regulator of sigma subunit)
MFVYRAKTKKVEKVIPGGLAGGIRIIKKLEDIQVKHIELEDHDIILTFSDGVVEAKNEAGEFYGLDRLEKTFGVTAKSHTNTQDIYTSLIEDLKLFKSGTSFLDDTTIILLKRDEAKDIVTHESVELKEITAKE